jgi:hypothetical protein
VFDGGCQWIIVKRRKVFISHSSERTAYIRRLGAA